MKFGAKENTFFVTFHENTPHPLKDNLGNVTMLEPVQEHLRGKERNTIAQEEKKLSVDIPMLLLFQNPHQLLHTASRNKAIHSYYSK